MQIGDLAAATGVSTRALRYYEEQGLLTPLRSAGGHRRYGPDAVERVQWIQRLFAAGLSSSAILGLPPCGPSGLDLDATLQRLVGARDRIDSQMRELAATRDSLDGLIEQAQRERAARRRAPAS
ncbi:MerR family transcriptional regulator [Actinoplanes cyaneus]|uniref:MerR family transcriptional regulator n=1 Tax=Actinoplanes cyaneus TaxID=52696 RepID=A0A919MDK1_9ACTN|nr:MerR family transcriptional regulator [Actinoplanes cyaneus]MCW2141172.1 DNA-binding transcriptional regulator, MerR family [Actinoplanes cyaneus]GID67236.1 MerR family transcriptional regulator [Actinoplanes cyaneus]